MKRFEYIKFKAQEHRIMEILGEYGSKGWELVTLIPEEKIGHYEHFTLYFKREVVD